MLLNIGWTKVNCCCEKTGSQLTSFNLVYTALSSHVADQHNSNYEEMEPSLAREVAWAAVNKKFWNFRA